MTKEEKELLKAAQAVLNWWATTINFKNEEYLGPMYRLEKAVLNVEATNPVSPDQEAGRKEEVK